MDGRLFESKLAPVALIINPVNEEPDTVTVTVLPAVAVAGAVIEAPALLAAEPWPGVLQLPAPEE